MKEVQGGDFPHAAMVQEVETGMMKPDQTWPSFGVPTVPGAGWEALGCLRGCLQEGLTDVLD